jgi:hypothetical protein
MWLFIGATTAPTLTRAAAGNYYYQCTSSQTVTAICPLSTFLQRTGYAQVAQEQFGSSSGGPSTYGPGPNQGYPPFTGSTQLTPTSAFFKKGIQVNDITLVYGITGAALTSQTMTFQKALYANTSAVAVTAITLSTATALATASTTNPYVTKISVSSPGFVVSDNTQLTIENTIVLPASAVYNLYGAMIHCSFNVA